MSENESSIVSDPWTFVCEWYDEKSIFQALQEMGHNAPPKNTRSFEFAQWMAYNLRLAMLKGADLAKEEMRSRPCVHELAKQFSENTTPS